MDHQLVVGVQNPWNGSSRAKPGSGYCLVTEGAKSEPEKFLGLHIFGLGATVEKPNLERRSLEDTHDKVRVCCSPAFAEEPRM